MTTAQEDLIAIYNNLLVFNKNTLLVDNPKPISVKFDRSANALVFSQGGINVHLTLPVYYSLGLDEIKGETYLLPEDYNYLMQSLSNVISEGRLIEDRTTISPENYGFDIYAVNLKEFWRGPQVLGKIRFVSGNSWIFKLIVKFKYKI